MNEKDVKGRLSAEEVEILKEHFDADFYLSENEDVMLAGIDPFEHYIYYGIDEFRSPVGWFDPKYYASTHTDLNPKEINLFLHYILSGKEEGREATSKLAGVPTGNINLDSLNFNQAEYELIAEHFDEAFYLTEYEDVKLSDLTPVEHYIQFGSNELRSPVSWFEPKYYLDNYPDIKNAGINPFIHYLVAGKNEGRFTNRSSELQFVKERSNKSTNSGSFIDADASIVEQVCPKLKAVIDYKEVELAPIENTFNTCNLNIHVVIPDYGIGGGGHMNIFRMLSYFEKFGHQVTIWIMNPHHQTEDEAIQTLMENYYVLKANVRFLDDSFEQANGDIIVASSWETVWPVCSVKGFKKRFYFIQDFEPLFSARGANSVLAESTYTKDLECICASTWLRDLMVNEYGRWATHFVLTADRSVYYPTTEKKNKIPKIAFYGRVHTERRGVELGLLALELLAKEGIEFEVECFGVDYQLEHSPYPIKFYETCTQDELAYIYNQCDIGLVFSLTNYSLVPQEMMASGLPVVEFDNESTRAIYPEGIVTLAGPSPEGIKEKLKYLISHEAERNIQSAKALNWISQYTWKGAAKKIEQKICDRLIDTGFTAESNTHQVEDKTKVTVVIPTYNPGKILSEVLDALASQETPWPFEILILDSQSTDNTKELASCYKNLRFVTVDKAEFNHGETRNYGASIAKGEFVAFITHDAIPANKDWLYNLVTLLEIHPKAAGVFGRHIAHDNATFYTRIELEQHFNNFKNYPISISKFTEKPPELQQSAWEGILRFYSDNNSCFRKSVWEKIPYRKVQYGEDQIWGQDIIDAGFEKVYAHSAVVKHSHDYDSESTFERAKIDADFFKYFFNVDVVNVDEVNVIKEAFKKRDELIAIQHGLSEEALNNRIAVNNAKLDGFVAGLAKERSLFHESSIEKSKF